MGKRVLGVLSSHVCMGYVTSNSGLNRSSPDERFNPVILRALSRSDSGSRIEKDLRLT